MQMYTFDTFILLFSLQLWIFSQKLFPSLKYIRQAGLFQTSEFFPPIWSAASEEFNPPLPPPSPHPEHLFSQ